jgi:hypothetical protein
MTPNILPNRSAPPNSFGLQFHATIAREHWFDVGYAWAKFYINSILWHKMKDLRRDQQLSPVDLSTDDMSG